MSETEKIRVDYRMIQDEYRNPSISISYSYAGRSMTFDNPFGGEGVDGEIILDAATVTRGTAPVIDEDDDMVLSYYNPMDTQRNSRSNPNNRYNYLLRCLFKKSSMLSYNAQVERLSIAMNDFIVSSGKEELRQIADFHFYIGDQELKQGSQITTGNAKERLAVYSKNHIFKLI